MINWTSLNPKSKSEMKIKVVFKYHIPGNLKFNAIIWG